MTLLCTCDFHQHKCLVYEWVIDITSFNKHTIDLFTDHGTRYAPLLMGNQMNGLGHYMSHYCWHCLCINLSFQFVMIPFTGINIDIILCFVYRVLFTCVEEGGFGYG